MIRDKLTVERLVRRAAERMGGEVAREAAGEAAGRAEYNVRGGAHAISGRSWPAGTMFRLQGDKLIVTAPGHEKHPLLAEGVRNAE